MAVNFRSSTNTTYASRTNTTLNLPSNTANGDRVLLFFLIGASGTAPVPTFPAGFTQVAAASAARDGNGFGVNLYVYSKIASSEPSTYTITHSAASSQGCAVTVENGGNSPSINIVSRGSGLGTTTTATGITTEEANQLLLYVAHDWEGTGALNPPTGFTERLDGLLYVASKTQTTAGATGNISQTNGNTAGSSPFSAWLIGIRDTADPTAISTISYRSIANTTYTSRTNTTINAPSGVTDGDKLVLFMLTASSPTGSPPTITAPAGFTAANTRGLVSNFNGWDLALYAFHKTANSEPSTYTITHSAASSQAAIVAINSGGQPIKIDAYSKNTVSNISGSTPAVINPLATSQHNNILVYGINNWTDAAQIVHPASFTERFKNGLLSVATVTEATKGTFSNTYHIGDNSTYAYNNWLIAISSDASVSSGTGSLSTTDVGDTATATSTLQIKSASSITDAGDILSTASRVQIKSVSAITETNDSISSNSAVEIGAMVAAIENSDTFSSSSALLAQGIIDILDTNDTTVSAATLPIEANLVQIEDNDSFLSSSVITVKSDINVTENSDSLVATSRVDNTALLSLINSDDTILAVSKLTINASVDLINAGDITTSQGKISVAAVLDNIEENDLFLSNNSQDLLSNLSIIEESDNLVSISKLLIAGNVLHNESNDTVSLVSRVPIAGKLAYSNISDNTLITSALLNTLNIEITEQDDVVTTSGGAGGDIAGYVFISEEDDAIHANTLRITQMIRVGAPSENLVVARIKEHTIAAKAATTDLNTTR